MYICVLLYIVLSLCGVCVRVGGTEGGPHMASSILVQGNFRSKGGVSE